MIIEDGRQREPEARVPVWVLRSDSFALLIRTSPLAAHVLLLLWSHANHEDQAWCSQRRLARLAGTHRRTVVVALATLRELGWIERGKSRKGESGEQLVDLYRMSMPHELEAVRLAVNARMRGEGGGQEIPCFRPDDIFQGRTRLYIRMCIIPRSALASSEWATLRSRSGLAMHLYLLLCAYGAADERVGGRRLAMEAHMDLRRIRAALALLGQEDDRWITPKLRTLQNGGCGASSYVIEDRLFSPAVGLDDDGGAENEVEIPDGAPPEDLVNQLPGPQQEAARAGLSDAEVWGMLRAERIWPRVENGEQRAVRLVREFHTATKGSRPGYQPTPAEWAFVRELFRAYERDTWRLVSEVVADLRKRGKFMPDNFAGLRAFIAPIAGRLGLVARIPVSVHGGHRAAR